MSKNGSRIISFGRYRATDLLLFAAILAVFEVIMFFAYTTWFAEDSSRFMFSIAVPVSLIVMIRWNWYGMFYAVGSGLLYCTLLAATGNMPDGGTLLNFVVYGVGNAFAGLAYLMVRFMGYKRITAKWYFTVLYAIVGWLAVYLGRVTVYACFGNGFADGLLFFLGDLLSLGMAIVVMLVMRRLEGMLEYQKDYLLRLDKERREKLEQDNFGEQFAEIDEETLKTLNKKGDDLF